MKDFPSSFSSGTVGHPIHVTCIQAAGKPGELFPMILLHGAFHTSESYLTTPDGRGGWATYFSNRGRTIFVPDWPGHGKSRVSADYATLSTLDVAEAIGVLLREVGPAIVVAHSAAGPVAWWLSEEHPDLVRAVVGIAPGPPGNIQAALPSDPDAIAALKYDSSVGCPVYSDEQSSVTVGREFIFDFWANSQQFPTGSIDAYAETIVPESARILNERFNIGGTALRLNQPDVVASRPIMIMTGELDPRHPKEVDAALADFLRAEHLWLPDAGILGNGHMLMIEKNSDDIAGAISSWLDRKGL